MKAWIASRNKAREARDARRAARETKTPEQEREQNIALIYLLKGRR